MIAFSVRVDDRLLHGQVLAAWAPFTKDEAAFDGLLKGKIQ
ncbi:MAG: PTS sugar transporter subunit IIB [Thermodesulfobacteriota bacterium]